MCASSGITYPSACHAECAEDEEYIEGICLKPCDCLDDWQPVCDVNGRTHQNLCVANCYGKEIAHEGACNCNCPAYKNPVCGNNQVTYLNSCYAKCAGVGVLYLKRCEEFPKIHNY